MATPVKPTTHRWIPWSLAAAFLPVLAINMLLVRLALSSSTGLVSDHAFDTGQNYNGIIAEGQRAAALGWRGNARLDAVPGDDRRRARLTVTVTELDGTPLTGLLVSGRLTSPVDPQPDQDVTLADDGAGRYRLELTLPRSGQWEAQMLARRGAQIFAIEQRLILP
jgi:nitrogen fixation protein FixH